MSTELFLSTVCFFGALVQTTTGLGFGLIVAPLLLAVYAPVDAIQITGALTLTIVLIITPFVVKNVLGGELGQLALGSLIGLLVGSACLIFLPINGIRLAALLVLLYSFFKYVRSHLVAREAKRSNAGLARHQPSSNGLFYGLASGVMGATLAMPGPMALVFLREKRIEPARVRATVFALMIGSYSGMLLISASLSGISGPVLSGLHTYLPPTLAGLLIGSLLARHMPALLFDIITTLLMLITLVALSVKIFSTHF